MWLVLLWACEPGALVVVGDPNPATEIAPRTEMTVTLVESLPHRAPGVALLATLGADNRISVGGTVQAELWVDTDTVEDERYAFRYRILDAAHQPIYARSTSGPVIVRDFLEHYGEQTGYSILELFPLLGTFAVTVPLLEAGATVEFQIRDGAGEDGVGHYQTLGEYDLGKIIVDDLGVAVAAVDILHAGGPSENALDLVIVPDGYQQDELSQFAVDAALVADALLATSPLAEYPEMLNLYRIDVPSTESGASYDCQGTCEMRDTAFDSFFPLELVNRVIGANLRTTAVFQLDQWEVARAASNVPWDLVLVIVNTEHEGGFAVHYSTVTRSMSNLGTIAGHELFHVLGQLGDEYNSDECIRSESLGLPDNITDSPASPPWGHWISDETPLPTPSDDEYGDVVGAFESAYNCDDLYRPQQACLMRGSSTIPELCSVCEELVTRRIFRYADAATGAASAASENGAYHFEITVVHPDASVEWILDGEVFATGTTLELGPIDVPAGTHTLSGRATLDSAFVLEDQGDLSNQWEWEIR